MKDGEIKHKLSPAQVSVMEHRVTEPPYFGKYWDHVENGIYRCAACDTPLFGSSEKFDSKTGWPSFRKPINERDLQFKSETGPDDKVELRCKKCKAHLGYVIAGDVPYYRINSVCLIFEAAAVAATVPTEGSTKGTLAQTEPPIENTLPVIEMNPLPENTWHMWHVVGGLLIGLLLGSSLTTLYQKRTPTSLSDTAATSTDEIATSTDGAPIESASPETTTAPEPKPTPTVDETVQETPDAALVAPDNSTSTQ